MRVALIACCALKLDHAAPASRLYQGALFQKSKRYAEQTCDQFAILSAKYGLVLADQVIEPYDQTLNRMTSKARWDWAGKVLDQMTNHWPLYQESVDLMFLAGIHYRENIIDMLSTRRGDVVQGRVHVSVPMRGMPIGKQLQWLGQQIAG